MSEKIILDVIFTSIKIHIYCSILHRTAWKKKNLFLLHQILTTKANELFRFFLTEINNRSDRFTINISSSECKKKEEERNQAKKKIDEQFAFYCIRARSLNSTIIIYRDQMSFSTLINLFSKQYKQEILHSNMRFS
jgi:hypothetical protein